MRPAAAPISPVRLIAQKLQETAGFTVIVDNRAGAAGMLGTEVVARAPADGYTLLYADVAHGINPAVYPRRSTIRSRASRRSPLSARRPRCWWPIRPFRPTR